MDSIHWRFVLELLHRAWSKATQIGFTGFLTLLVALGTLATAYVAYKTANDTHEQVQLLKRQVEFNASETRPFLRVKPAIIPWGKNFRVLMGVVNVGHIPGRVLAYDMTVQVGRRLIERQGSKLYTGDIIYPEQPGLELFRMLTQEQASTFVRGSEPVVVGGCVVFGSITTEDNRRWEVSNVYRFDSLDELPLGLFANEVSIPLETSSCDADSLRDKWAAQIRLSK